eukprot:119853-Chlamydomonas_euryale.AAC.7
MHAEGVWAVRPVCCCSGEIINFGGTTESKSTLTNAPVEYMHMLPPSLLLSGCACCPAAPATGMAAVDAAASAWA